MDSSKVSQQFFCQSIGSTLAILQYFPLSRSRRLISSLSRKTKTFYDNQENNVFKSCLPTQFASVMKHEVTFKGSENRFCIRVVHLRDMLVIALYASNEVEIRDLSKPQDEQLLDKLEIDSEEPPIDIDVFNHDERYVIVGYRSNYCYLLNFKTRSVNQFEHMLPQPLQQVQFLQNFPSGNFFTISKGGVFRVWEKDSLQCREVAKFHALQFITETHRPFSNLIELQNDQENSLQLSNEKPNTMMVFIIQGKNMHHSVVFYNYFGLNDQDNKLSCINIQGQLIHSLKQLRTRYLAVSLDKELRIYDIPTRAHLRSVQTDQPFQFLATVSPSNYRFELDMIAEACVGYSYKTFYECGVTIGPGHRMLDHQFQAIQELEQKRKRIVFKVEQKPNAIISQCQIQMGNENYLIVTPREEQDTIIIFRLSLL